MVNFGQKLKQLRTNSGMTQAQLAVRLNVTKSVVSYYELQERLPSPEIVIKLAGIFHVTTDYLLGVDQCKSVDVSGLNDEDLKFVLLTIETLKKKNK